MNRRCEYLLGVRHLTTKNLSTRIRLAGLLVVFPFLLFGALLFSIHAASGMAIIEKTAAPGMSRDAAQTTALDNQIFLPMIGEGDMTGGEIHPVVADVDRYATDEDVLLQVAEADGVLANDSASAESTLQALLIDDVANGVLTLNENGAFTYQPAPDYHGQDRFVYRATDGSILSDSTRVTVMVGAVNDQPVAVADDYNGQTDMLLEVDVSSGVLANDADVDMDSLQAVLATDVRHGDLTMALDGSFRYFPDPGFSGTDYFAYVASDTISVSNPVTVTIAISVNRPPRIDTGIITFTKQVIDDEVDQTHSVVAADLDGDRDIDLAATDYVGDSIYWYENDGQLDFEKHLLDIDLDGAYPSHVNDVDLDGDMDILAAGYDADTFVWYRNNGSGRFRRIDIDAAADGAHSIVVADLDEDGDNDLVTSSQDASNVAWYENDGEENFTAHVIDEAAPTAKRAEVADVDSDGDLDVIAASTDHEVAWYENDGEQAFTKHVIDPNGWGAYYVAMGDLDDDGDVDVLSVSQWFDSVNMYRNDGEENFEHQVVDESADGARTVLVADVDNDGSVDLVASSVEDDTVAWHRNDGKGNFTKHPVDSAADGAYGLFVLDMDFDGDVDVLSASRDDDTVAIHLQTRLHRALVAPGGTVAIERSLLRTVDADDGPDDLFYTLAALPDAGDVRLDGVTMILGSTFTQTDVNDGRVSYVQSGEDSVADQFALTVADGGESGVQPAGILFVIDIRGAVRGY